MALQAAQPPPTRKVQADTKVLGRPLQGHRLQGVQIHLPKSVLRAKSPEATAQANQKFLRDLTQLSLTQGIYPYSPSVPAFSIFNDY